MTLQQVWDGDGDNDNAALTVLRHFDNATVTKGLLGGSLKTVWVVSYAVLERIHYLLVAGFDVFGNLGHQLHTRLYMDFLRMEAEHNFLILLPRARRRELVDAWYRDTGAAVKELVFGKVAKFAQESGISYQSSAPERELHRMLREHLAPGLERKHELAQEADPKLRAELERLTLLEGTPAALFPETSLVEIAGEDGANPSYFTLLRDSAHTNVAQLFREHKRRRPGEDRITVARGLLTAYPHALFALRRAELSQFVAAIELLDGAPAYAALRARFGVRRTDPNFWTYSDRLLDAYQTSEPLTAGLLDYNRLENR